MIKLPTLYKLTSKGAVQTWTIETTGNVITTTHGQQDGKKQVNSETISLGKNIGRANETNPEQQAEAEALSAWNKKKDRQGYKESLEEIAVKSDDGGAVMLCHKYSEHADKMSEICFSQPKLDGHRCKAVTRDGVCTLYSRTNNIILGVPHINRFLESHFPNTILDGELYNHEYHKRFEELTSFIRQETPKEGHDIVQYHLYDVINCSEFKGENTEFYVRFDYLLRKKELYQNGPLRLVDTRQCHSPEDIEKYFRIDLGNGFEGSILRSIKGHYKNGRSYDLQKVKEMDDSEFLVTAITEGRGKMMGAAILQCSMDSGETFDCKLKGSYDNLKLMFENPNDYVGKKVTVQYQGFTRYGKPRFPVGLRFRTDV